MSHSTTQHGGQLTRFDRIAMIAGAILLCLAATQANALDRVIGMVILVPIAAAGAAISGMILGRAGLALATIICFALFVTVAIG